ncbi:histidine kinase [Jatrophihabitans sp. GAS493]|uniref:sensor histidine kinase n=1 Tax=Jatrophihabitans sp. GAS493 TaxID=1907575 RepID=UPI000BB77254|nr:GAF domain-containing protein [Jatrophihabitans sp. GAS493]SOD70888.1 histidine kinase [Jatrophihabitans sp. GAS493]
MVSVTVATELPLAWRELDRQLTSLRELADDVHSAGERLQDLLRVTQHVIGDLRLPVVLRRVVEVACRLSRSDVGVLALLGPGERIREFVLVGISDEDDASELVRSVHADGLLCPPSEESLRMQLCDFGHLPVTVAGADAPAEGVGALGVSIRVRGENFANVYVLAPNGGGFFRQDEELLTALAETAGVAIDNARLFEESRARQQWLQASAEITSELLRNTTTQPLELIVQRTLEVADADAVMVMLPDEHGVRLEGAVGVDRAGNRLTDPGVPIVGSTHGLVMLHSRPIRIAEPTQLLHRARAESLLDEYGQMMMLPLVDARGARGVLTICRRAGRSPFTDADLQMATSFASHAALSLELSDARKDLERVLLLEDRDRIARDLHDHVIARLFATGLVLERIAADVGAGDAASRLLARVGDIDDTIREIRSSIFQLRAAGEEASGSAEGIVIPSLLAIAGEAEEALGFAPTLRFHSTSDAIPPQIADDLAAVLREALANVVRHARATRVDIEVEVGAELVSLTVRDDGVGLSGRARSSGLENLGQRAQRWGGEFHATSGGAGTSPVTGTSAVAPTPAVAPTTQSRAISSTSGFAAAFGDGGPGALLRGTTLRWRVPLNGQPR